MDDKELVRKVRSGDKEAWSIIIDRYYTDVFRFCLYMTRSESDAYDITQETFLRFIKYGVSYRHNNLKGYLLTIARNVCITYFQQEKLSACVWKDVDEIPFDRNRLEEAEASVYLGRLLGELSEEVREVIILRIYEEMKFKNIAQIMGCSISTAKSRFRIGLKQLNKRMEDDYE